MRIIFLVIYSFAIFGSIYLGTRHIHRNFGYYMIGGMILLWLGFKLLEHISNKKLALILVNLSKEEREEHLSKFSNGHKKSINNIIEKLVEQGRGEE